MELIKIKEATFVNVMVCKAKLEQWQSIIDVSDQVIIFAPENLKCWFFRGKAFVNIENYPEGIICFKKLLELDPNHALAKKELKKAL